MTRLEFEIYQNELLVDDDLYDKFHYLTEPSRGEYISPKDLKQAIRDKKLATIVNRFDPIAFNIMYNDCLQNS